MDKPRPGPEIGAAEGDCLRRRLLGNSEMIGHSRLLLAKTRMRDVNSVRNLASFDNSFFFSPSLPVTTLSRSFFFHLFNDDELKSYTLHPSLALTNMQHSRA